MKKFLYRIGLTLHATELALLVVYLISCVTLSSCFIGEKTKSNKVTGTWKMINTWDMTAQPSDDTYWQFQDGAFNMYEGFPPIIFS